MHERMHFAGLDLTRALRKAPHGLEVFRRWPVVGRLEVS
jgi:predicted heme/steroid binding protein